VTVDLSQPMILQPRRARLLAYLALSMVFVAGAVFMITDGSTITGSAVLLFFGGGMLFFVVMLLPGAGYLRIDRDGFTMCAAFKRTFTPWSEVRGFGVTRIGYRHMVGVHLAPGGRFAAGVGRVNAELVGFEGALPDTYKIKAETLAVLMNEALAQARLNTAP